MAHVLNACGLRCFHEVYFAPGQVPVAWRYDGKYAEVSPAAYALRRNIPPGALTLHQVRNPVDVINSLFYTSHCRWSPDGEPSRKVGFNQRAWDLLYLRSMRDVVWHHDRMLRCAEFWQAYNKRISEYVNKRDGWRYRVEDVSVELITRIFEAVGVAPDESRIKEVIENTSTTVNRLKREPARVFDWRDMTRNQITQAANYGYADERRSV